MFKSSNKASLDKILENSLANRRAARDLEGIIGIKGGFAVLDGDVDTHINISVTTAGTTEIQTMTFSEEPIDGTFQVGYDSVPLGAPISYDSDLSVVAGEIEAALQLDPNLADVTVAPVGTTWAEGFEITMFSLAAPLMVEATNVDMVFADPITVTPSIDTPGVIQVVSVDFENKTPTGGSFTLDFGTYSVPEDRKTGPITWDDDANTIEGIIQGTHPSLNQLTVTGTYATGLIITYEGIAGPEPLPLIGDVSLVDGGGAINITRNLDVDGAIEIQAIDFSDVPDGGEWRIKYGAWTTAPLAHDIAFADLQTAFRAMDSSLDDVQIGGDFAGGFEVSYYGVPNPLELEIDATSDLYVETPVTSIDVTDTTPWVPQAQTISFSNIPTDGEFELNYDGDVVGPFDENAVHGDLQTALQTIAGLGDVTVSGTYAAGFVVTFVNVPLNPELLDVESNTLEGPGVAEAIGIGSGFFVAPVVGAEGAFNVYLERKPKNFIGADVIVFEPKATADSSDIFRADVSGYNFNTDNPYITIRIVRKDTGVVYAPTSECVLFFDVKCTYSDETGY